MALLLVLLLGTGRVTPSEAQSPDQATPVDFAEIDRYAEKLLRADRVPGAAVAIVRGGRILHIRGFGVDQRGRPIDGSTAFVLGSMSKSFTALAIMQLVERGQVDLDQPVRRYLPAFRLASADGGAKVTVRQLLLHTSGIPHRATRGVGATPTLGAHVDALGSVKPRDAAGSHAYASPNYLVLGAIVEAVTGESFAAYVQRAIFEPLGMHGSFTDRTRAVRHGFAGGHVYALGFPLASSVRGEPDRLPTAGLMSSASDLSRFLIMQLQGGRSGDLQVLAAPYVAQMHTGVAPSDGFSYAFGWRDGQIGGVRAVHHGGIIADFRGRMVMLPDSGWGVVVLTNASSAIPWPLAPTSHRLAGDIAARLAGRALPSPSSRHRAFFGVLGLVMIVALAAQVRTVRRTVRAATTATAGAPAAGLAWRASALDVAFIVFVALLPRVVGLTWIDLLRGAPDVAWWLVSMAALGAATVGFRVRAFGARGRSSVPDTDARHAKRI